MALRQSVGGLATTLLSMVRTRLELFALEASGQKSHLIRLAGMAFGALLFASLAILVFSIAIALYFWPSEYRYTALFMLALIYAILGLILGLALRRSLVRAPLPFSATLDELRHDIALLERLKDSDKNPHRYRDDHE